MDTEATTEQPAAIPAKPAALKPVHIDGALYVIMALAGSIVASTSTDEALKFVSPYTLFVTKTICEAILAGAGALKMYRSTGYADSVKS